jgi:glutamate carboxypeptidase
MGHTVSTAVEEVDRLGDGGFEAGRERGRGQDREGRLRRLEGLRRQVGAMADDLAVLVDAESPSGDPEALRGCAKAVAKLGTRLLGVEPEWLERAGRPHLRWRFEPGGGGGTSPRVVLLAHFDTVWPVGTRARWAEQRTGDTLTGPGAYDCKAGIVQGMYALASLGGGRLGGVELLCNGDEEIGSPGSEELIVEASRDAAAVLVLEPSGGGRAGALKTSRKGIAIFEVSIGGRAAHAGNNPEAGVNATVELAHQVLAIAGLARPELGTSVTPTLATSGTSGNTVPAAARLHVDVRTREPGELERVAAGLRGLVAVLPGASVEVVAGPARPPLPASATEDVLATAQKIAADLGIGSLGTMAVGGGSDGNLAAAVGAPVLDGLGAVGDHIHAEGEYVVVPAMPERAALVAGLVEAYMPAPFASTRGSTR